MPTQPDWMNHIEHLAKKGQHPHIEIETLFHNGNCRFYCVKCSWEQILTPQDFANDQVEWTIPKNCYTYKERWEGKFDNDDTADAEYV